MTTTTQMIRKAEELEAQARTLRDAAALMNGHYTAKASTQIGQRLSKAAALRAEPGPDSGDGRYAGQQRRRAILMQALDPTTAYRLRDLKRILYQHHVGTGDHAVAMDMRALGWTTTGRAQAARWTHDGPGAAAGPHKRKQTKSDKTRDRKATARLLQRIEKSDDPMPASRIGRSVSSLLQHGYIARKGDGYVRTDKAFEA